MGKSLFAIVCGAVLAAAPMGTCAATVEVAEGETYELASSVNKDNSTVIVAAAGAEITLPKGSGAFVFYPHLVASGGVVRVTCAAGSSYQRVRFVSGLRGVEGGSLVVDGVTLVTVDRQNWGASITTIPALGPVCDIADVSFTSDGVTDTPTGLKGLLLRNNATVRQLPTTCPVWVEKGATVALAGTNTASAAALLTDGALAVTNFDVIASTAACLPAGCKVQVSPGCKFIFRRGDLSEDGCTWTAAAGATGRFNIDLLGRGAKVWIANQGVNLRCESNVTGLGEILIRSYSGSTLTRFRGLCYSTTSETPVSIPVDTAHDPAPTDTWKTKVAHWFDASDADTLVPFTFDPNAAFGWTGASNTFDGHTLIIGWKDKVASSTLSLYNTRLWNNVANAEKMKDDYNLQVLPYVVEGGLNGKNYICCGTRGVSKVGAKYNASGQPAAAGEGRRLRFWNTTAITGDAKPAGAYTTYQPQYCILVFGSQNGGGGGVVGSKDDPANGYGAIVRKYDNGADEFWTTRAGFSLHVDGLTVNPRTSTPNGGWQIVSIDMTGTNTLVTGLGTVKDTDSDCGGQNYAEAIFFAEKPTVAERAACERYLAAKWGLESSYVQWDTPLAHLGGTGTVLLYDDANAGNDSVETLDACGAFSGIVSVPAGKTLDLTRPCPPTAADVPAANRVGWYDPDFTGAATFDGGYGHDDLLNILYARTLTGLCTADDDLMFSSGNRSGYKGNFAPRVVNAARGWLSTAPRRNWLVFAEAYSDGVGNMIRSRKVGAGVTSGMVAAAIRQAFFVTDTTDGGGELFSDNSLFRNGQVKPRQGDDVNDPIWSPSNTVTMTSTWLDTTEIDGTSRGYNGRAEVLSFTTAEDYKLGYVADFAGKNTEVVGEWITYSAPLSDAARTTVQEYLMYKWFGDLNGGKYADWTGATVTGEGTVRSATLRNLPAFGAKFTGALTGGTALAFTVDAAVDAAAATDALALAHDLTLAEGATVTVTVGAHLAPGVYTLLSAPSVRGTAALAVAGETGGCRLKLRVTATAIELDVTQTGTVLVIR